MRVQVSLRAQHGRCTAVTESSAVQSGDGDQLRPFFLHARAMKRHSTNLSPRIKSLVAFTAFLSLQKRKNAYSLMCRQLDRNKQPPELFSEALLHLSLFLGYPPILEGLEVLSLRTTRTLESASLDTSKRNVAARGMSLFKAVYGNQASRVLRNLERLHPGLASHILEEPYGRFMSRAGIDLSEREILNVVVLFIQGYRKQLYSHLRGALKTGVTRSILVDVLKYAGSLSSISPKSVINTLQQIDRRGQSSHF